MLTLNLIRHAKTEVHSASGRDKERELAPKGISQSNILGKNIRIQFIELGKLYCSSAFRTQQTCSIILQQLGTNHPFELSDRLYASTREELFNFLIEKNSSESTVTIIGHNNGISDLATYLLDEYIDMGTGEMLSMTLPFSSWTMISKGTATLISRYRPQVFLPDPVTV